ncbi:MAG: hypothetical protein ACRD3Q_18260 [Terriglobales bacterium]
MADAARSARTAFKDIGDGAASMGEHVGKGSLDVRHALGLVDNTIRGAHSMAMVDLIRMFQNSALVMGALPFAMVVAGFALVSGIVYEAYAHVKQLKEEQEKLTAEQEHFLTAAHNAFNSLDQQLLQAGIKADELNHDHLGALQKQLALIDRASMSELVKSFEEVAKAADVVMAELKGHWYTFGIGSAGAQHALEQFKTHYDLLLAQGRDKDASDLLAGTRQSAQHLMDMMTQLRVYRDGSGAGAPDRYLKAEEALQALRKAGISDTLTDKEYHAQSQLVDALNAQVTVEEKLKALKAAQSGNAVHETSDKMEDEAERVLRERLQAQAREQDQEDALYMQNRERAISELQQGEREKVDATEKGSAERLAAIAAALQEEERYGLQDTAFYKELLTQRVETMRQMADEEAKLRAQAGQEEAAYEQKMGLLQIAADHETWQVLMSGRQQRIADTIRQETLEANAKYQIQMAAYAQESAALDKHAKDYENKLKAINNRESELTKQHENEITAIKDRAEKERNQRALSALQQLEDMTAQGLANVLMRHESFGAMIVNIGDTIATGMIQTAIKSMLAEDMTKEKEASHAARMMYLAGAKFPFPTNLVMAPVLAAGAFAVMMGLQEGGVVPGVGSGDIVPAMLEPGEGVLPKRLMENLSNAARSGPAGPSNVVHVHYTAHASALDSEGMDHVLDRHADKLNRRIESTLRRMNH